MHFAFIPYGKRAEVELLLRDMEAQKFLMPMTQDGKEQKVWIQGVVRICPLGIYDYVFPKENLDMVLATICNYYPDGNPIIPYNIGWIKLALLRKITQSKPIPKFKRDKVLLWIKDNVNIIPIGIKEDKEIIAPEGIYAGWRHEAL